MISRLAKLSRDVHFRINRGVGGRVFAAALTIGLATGVVGFVTFVKDLVIAYRFGTGDEVDAFAIAFTLPFVLISIVTGSLGSTVIPAYVSVRVARGEDEASRLFSAMLGLGLLLLLALTALLAVIFPHVLPLLASNFEAPKQALTQSLFYVVLPIIILGGCAAMWMAGLNARGVFGAVALAPVVVPLATMIAVLALADRLSGHALALGTLLGFALQFGALAVIWRGLGLTLRPRWSGVTPELDHAVRQYLPALGSMVLMGAITLINQAMAATLGAGSVAALGYGYKIVSLVAGVSTLALATAVLPHFSELVSRRDWTALSRLTRTYVALILALSVPVSLLIFWQSEAIVSLLFERGAFGRDDTHLVGEIQRYYALQIPFWILGTFFARLLSALHQNRIMFFGALINLPLNLVLNFAFIRWFDVAGIALSTSIVYLVSCSFLGLMAMNCLVRARDAAP